MIGSFNVISDVIVSLPINSRYLAFIAADFLEFRILNRKVVNDSCVLWLFFDSICSIIEHAVSSFLSSLELSLQQAYLVAA